MTKFFGLYDISLGWIIAPEQFANKAAAIERHTNAVAKPSRELAKRAFANQTTLIDQSHDMLETRSTKLQSFLNTTPSLTSTAISPGVLAFVTHDTLPGTDFVNTARAHGIALQSGRFFSPTSKYDDYFRIAVVRGDPHLSAGLAQLHDLCTTLD
jgi:DNA-binding transcriptional MocR family regulator